MKNLFVGSADSRIKTVGTTAGPRKK